MQNGGSNVQNSTMSDETNPSMGDISRAAFLFFLFVLLALQQHCAYNTNQNTRQQAIDINGNSHTLKTWRSKNISRSLRMLVPHSNFRSCSERELDEASALTRDVTDSGRVKSNRVNKPATCKYDETMRMEMEWNGIPATASPSPFSDKLRGTMSRAPFKLSHTRYVKMHTVTSTTVAYNTAVTLCSGHLVDKTRPLADVAQPGMHWLQSSDECPGEHPSTTSVLFTADVLHAADTGHRPNKLWFHDIALYPGSGLSFDSKGFGTVQSAPSRHFSHEWSARSELLSSRYSRPGLQSFAVVHGGFSQAVPFELAILPKSQIRHSVLPRASW